MHSIHCQIIKSKLVWQKQQAELHPTCVQYQYNRTVIPKWHGLWKKIRLLWPIFYLELDFKKLPHPKKNHLSEAERVTDEVSIICGHTHSGHAACWHVTLGSSSLAETMVEYSPVEIAHPWFATNWASHAAVVIKNDSALATFLH